jgi:hypothetical protein
MGPDSMSPDEYRKFSFDIYCIVAYCTPNNAHRCFGYYTSATKAVNALEKGWREIEECLYDSFFIERFNEGLHPCGEIIGYYEIVENNKTGDLVKKDIPIHIKSFINWSLG